jgi:purine-binding chemotaxis protein CheW
MNALTHSVVFWLDEWLFALPLAAVDRIVRAVEVTPLANAPDPVLGVIDVQGRVVPVIDVRKRCGLPPRDIQLSDQMIIAHTSWRSVALLVDRAEVMECPSEDLDSIAAILPGSNDAREVVAREDGLILIHDINLLLSMEVKLALEGARTHRSGQEGGPP